MEKQGAFVESLMRNNKQIKADRATSISKTAKVMYKRKVEDLILEIDQMEEDRRNLLDLSPTNALTLVVASDFKASEFAEKDFQLSVAIRNAKIKLAIWQTRYNFLFEGGEAEDAPLGTEQEEVIAETVKGE